MDTLTTILNLMKANHYDNLKLADALSLNRQVVTDWRAGRSKSYQKYLPQIANCFHVSVDYLLGNETSFKDVTNANNLSTHEKTVIDAYRANPSMQPAVDRLLGLSESDPEYTIADDMRDTIETFTNILKKPTNIK